MDTTAITTRQRAVIATIADLIVAAAAGRTLRVAVGCTRPDETVFADQLTQALRARGRPGHCRTAKPKPVTTDGYTCAYSDADGPSVAVITSGTPGPDETDLCRVNIQLSTPNRVTAPVARAHSAADGQDPGSVGDQEPDIIVDYLDPGGPAIRHLGPAFAAPTIIGRLQSDRRVRPL
jgi:hypothetical protein